MSPRCRRTRFVLCLGVIITLAFNNLLRQVRSVDRPDTSPDGRRRQRPQNGPIAKSKHVSYRRLRLLFPGKIILNKEQSVPTENQSNHTKRIEQTDFEQEPKISKRSRNLTGEAKKVLAQSRVRPRWSVRKQAEQEFLSVLESKADRQRKIFISTVDYSFVDMAKNLFETSFRKWGIRNYVFVCSHQKARETLRSRGVDSVQLWNDTDGTISSDFSTVGFSRKTSYKTAAASLALSKGYTVIMVDVDIVFLKDPRPYLKCNDCEIIMQSDGNHSYRNTGFYLAHPTRNMIKLHHLVLRTFENEGPLPMNDQLPFNTFLTFLESHSNVSVKVLDMRLFPNGEHYFDHGQRMFAGDAPCPGCVIVHNNFIVSHSNKRYRFKEHLLWMLDEDQYFSNATAKYIAYENPFDFGETFTTQMEEEALRTSFVLGHILNRIVILPKFYCYQCLGAVCLVKHHTPRCPAYMHINMSLLDKELENKYRENVFLRNYLVPRNIKESMSPVILIKSKVMSQPHIWDSLDKGGVHKILVPSSLEEGATDEELLKWTKPFQKFSVLRFHSLYGKILSSENMVDIVHKVQSGIQSKHKRVKRSFVLR